MAAAIQLYSGTIATASTINYTPVPIDNLTDLFVHVYVGTLGGTSPTITAGVQWSADGTNWVTINGSATISASDTNEIFHLLQDDIPITGGWIRLQTVAGGTTPSVPVDIFMTYRQAV